MGAFRRGAALFSRWPRALQRSPGSSFAFVLSPCALTWTNFLALVVWAAASECEQRARAAGARAARQAACSPEGVAAARGPSGSWRGRRSVSGAVLVAVAPLVWAATDLWVTAPLLRDQ